MEDWKSQLRKLWSFVKPNERLLPKSVNLSPSNVVTGGDDTGFQTQSYSYDGTPQRIRQRQPFRWN